MSRRSAPEWDNRNRLATNIGLALVVVVAAVLVVVTLVTGR